MCRSTCFGRLHAHHQELTTTLTASGFTFELYGSSVVGRGLPGHSSVVGRGLAGHSSVVGRGLAGQNQQRCYHHAPR